MVSTCVGDPDGPHRDAGQLDGLAVEKFESGVAQILVRQFLENVAGVRSCDAEHANVLRDVADVNVVSAVSSLGLNPPGSHQQRYKVR